MAIADKTFPDLHDYRLVSIGWDADAKVLVLSFRDDEVRVDVQLDGVTRLRVTDLLEGNIVDEAVVLTAAPPNSGEPVVDLGKWIERLLLGDEISHSPPASVRKPVQDISLGIEAAKYRLLVITSSFGCEALVLFSTWKANTKA